LRSEGGVQLRLQLGVRGNHSSFVVGHCAVKLTADNPMDDSDCRHKVPQDILVGGADCSKQKVVDEQASRDPRVSELKLGHRCEADDLDQEGREGAARWDASSGKAALECQAVERGKAAALVLVEHDNQKAQREIVLLGGREQLRPINMFETVGHVEHDGS
jgi:hypothetical protein